MIDYRRELNDEQYGVVMEAGGPLLVIAGAGSGKTRTLTYRGDPSDRRGGRPRPDTARNLHERRRPGPCSAVSSPCFSRRSLISGAGTFHHIAHRILRANAERVGYDRQFSIIDAEDARQLMNTCLADKNLSSQANDFPKGNVLADILSLCVNTETTLEETVMSRYPFFIYRLDEIESVLRYYQERKKAFEHHGF